MTVKLRIVDMEADTVTKYGVCGYKDPDHPGYRKKVEWIRRRLVEGLRVKALLRERGETVGWIEYVPGEHAWRAVHAPGYMVIHCIFILKKAFKGRGYGSALLEACEKDARKQKMLGVAAVATRSTWMAKKDIFLRNGYEAIEEAPPHYELLVKRFDSEAPLPAFTGGWKRNLARYGKGLTIIHSDQCPYVAKAIDEIVSVAAADYGIRAKTVKIKTARSAQEVPNPFGVFSIIWNGELIADHPISKTRFKNIMDKIEEKT